MKMNFSNFTEEESPSSKVKNILKCFEEKEKKRNSEIKAAMNAIDIKYDRELEELKRNRDAAIEESYRHEREALARLRRS